MFMVGLPLGQAIHQPDVRSSYDGRLDGYTYRVRPGSGENPYCKGIAISETVL
jgi:hypothetical protein